MKKVKLIALFAALILGLAVYQFLKEISKPQETPRTQVVVAVVNIPENRTITSEMVALRPVATEALTDGYMRDVGSVVGMVASGDIFAGEQITSNRLIRMGQSEAESDTLAFVVKPGMRAITISVNPTSGLNYMLRPGNRVDLVSLYAFTREIEAEPEDPWAYEEQKEPETEEVQAAQILLQNVEILAVDNVLSKTGAGEYTTVTLQLTPEDAVKLSLADSMSSIRLLLRSPLDGDSTEDCYIEWDVLIDREEGDK